MSQIDAHRLSRACLVWLLTYSLIAAVWFASGAAAVELYRCTRDGAVEFRQTACPEGEQAITQVIDRNKGITPAEPGLRLIERQQEAPKPPVGVKQTQRATSERCWKTAKRLESVERRLRAGYKPSQYDGLHRKQTEYEEYLRLFCGK
jgi:hypothetical protein